MPKMHDPGFDRRPVHLTFIHVEIDVSMNDPPSEDRPAASESSPGSADAHRAGPLPQWRVMLHDDEVHERSYVADVLNEALPLSYAAAMQRVIQAHRHGVALILMTHRELAELYYLQLSKRDLIVSIEPA